MIANQLDKIHYYQKTYTMPYHTAVEIVRQIKTNPYSGYYITSKEYHEALRVIGE